MVIHRSILRALLAVVKAGGSDTRFSMGGVQVHPDQTVVATDGHVCFWATDAHPFEDADFPTKGIPDVVESITEPEQIPGAVVEAILKQKTGKGLPAILQGVLIGKRRVEDRRIGEEILTPSPTVPFIASTDLTIPIVVDLPQGAEKGVFPSVDRVKLDPAKDYRELILGVPVLEKILAAAKAIETDSVRMTIPNWNGAYRVRAAKNGIETPEELIERGELQVQVGVRMVKNGIVVDGVVMPMADKDDRPR